MAGDAHAAIDAVWKRESARIVAGLTRMVRDVGLAEELAQDALVAALEQWPRDGVPGNPGAWLMTTAKRRAVDGMRRGERLERNHERLAHALRTAEETGPEADDDVLRLMFVSCHPVLSREARAALTLKLLGGLTTEEIARAFLTPEATVAQRILRAKRTLARERIPFEMPEAGERAERLRSVLDVVYLVFNEGYTATAGDDLIRADLCREALRLGRMLAALVPGEAEVHGLVALMELTASRAAARTGPSGEPVPLHEQNRGRWDLLLIRRGFTALLTARSLGAPPGPYVLQAAIAAVHAGARGADDTDWARIVALYERLERVLPTPVVRLNHAVSVARVAGPETALALTDTLDLGDYHLLPAVRADLLSRLGRHPEAAAEFTRAAALTRNAPERALLLRRAEASAAAVPSFAAAVESFLAGLDAPAARSYGRTLRRLARDLGDPPLTEVTPALAAAAFTAAWHGAAPRTWNRHHSALRTFSRTAPTGDLTAALPRRKVPPGHPEPLDRGTVEALLSLATAAPRERALWRIVYESAAPAAVALSLNVEDLDLAADRAVIAGGRELRWYPATTDLLRSLVGSRTSGPLFLAERRPAPARGATGLCPRTGRGRLSYERAELLFKRHTGHTLHRLREARRLHLGF
ncbi:DUF6596 domain-containing protein [Actinocorallia longicatena]|uniref:RNA polymerase ECF family sigma subunit n=1 Tax=Actinocorallia longicatena TaxID=111803 RepID=A0ABP6Q8U6_9ACTN